MIRFSAILLLMLAIVAGCEKQAGEGQNTKPSVEPATQTEQTTATSASEQAQPADAQNQGPNSRFYGIQAKLDQGGTFYLYADVKDVLRNVIDKFGPVVNDPSSGMPPQAQMIYAGLQQLIEQLGLYGITDLGASSVPEESGLFRNKVFVALPDGRQGAMKLLGGAPHDFDALDYAPAETLFFSTIDFDMPQLLPVMHAMAQGIGGAAADQQLNQMLAQANMKLGADVNAVMGSLGDHINLFVTLDPARKMNFPPDSGIAPMNELQIACMIPAKDPSLYNLVKQQLLLQGAAGEETTENGVSRLTIKTTPNPVWELLPVMVYDGQYFYLSTNPDWLAKIMAKPGDAGLRGSEDFKKVMAGLPEQGNALTYMHQRALSTYQGFMKEVMTANKRENAQPMLFKRMMDLGKLPEVSQVDIRVNQADGLFYVKRSGMGGQQLVAAAAVMPVGIMAAIAIPNFLEAQSRSKVSRVKADMRTMATALESHYIDWNKYPEMKGSAMESLTVLTTPVAYITSVQKDPFMETEPSLHYWATNPNEKNKQQGWIMWSAGPDGQYDIQEQMVPEIYNPADEQPSPALIELTYDPTNGTTSRGDVWRHKE